MGLVSSMTVTGVVQVAEGPPLEAVRTTLTGVATLAQVNVLGAIERVNGQLSVVPPSMSLVVIEAEPVDDKVTENGALHAMRGGVASF